MKRRKIKNDTLRKKGVPRKIADKIAPKARKPRGK